LWESSVPELSREGLFKILPVGYGINWWVILLKQKALLLESVRKESTNHIFVVDIKESCG
jgi:hypothetical protein